MADRESLPVAQRWECADKRRYYVAVIQRDLFGDIEVWRCWGGIGSRRGGQQVSPANDQVRAISLLHDIGRRRASRGDRSVVSCESSSQPTAAADAGNTRSALADRGDT